MNNIMNKKFWGIKIVAVLLFLLVIWEIVNIPFEFSLHFLQIIIRSFTFSLLLVAPIAGGVGLLLNKSWGWWLSMLFLILIFVSDLFFLIMFFIDSRLSDDFIFWVLLRVFFLILLFSLIIYLLNPRVLKSLRLNKLKKIKSVTILVVIVVVLLLVNFLFVAPWAM